MDPVAHKAAMERLEPLVGEWSLDAAFPGVPRTGPIGRTVLKWTLDGQFLIQHSEISHPAAPVGFCIVGFDLEAKEYVQHYFDSRGVARVYEMTFDDGVWELTRRTPDFSPLDFLQRFVGTLSADGKTIEGAWETSKDGSTWERDFGLTYRRIAS
jgi:hypothetical protein